MLTYSYDRRAKENPADGLEGLFNGAPVTLYHGTTRLFRKFDLSQSRDDLVDRYYGRGIFLTPSKRVAEAYANANRNIGLEPSIIADLKRKNPVAGRFLEILVKHGNDGWDIAVKELGFLNENPAPGEGIWDYEGFQKAMGGVDPNTVDDVAGYVIGSASKPLGFDGGGNPFFQGTGAPGWLYDSLDEIGLDGNTYRPKVYTVTVSGVQNTLVTKNKSQASKAKAKGYEAVLFHGSDLVQGVPEVAVFDPRKVRIRSIEVA